MLVFPRYFLIVRNLELQHKFKKCAFLLPVLEENFHHLYSSNKLNSYRQKKAVILYQIKNRSLVISYISNNFYGHRITWFKLKWVSCLIVEKQILISIDLCHCNKMSVRRIALASFCRMWKPPSIYVIDFDIQIKTQLKL